MNKDDVDPLEDLVARDRAALRASKAAEAAELQAAKPESFGHCNESHGHRRCCRLFRYPWLSRVARGVDYLPVRCLWGAHSGDGLW